MKAKRGLAQGPRVRLGVRRTGQAALPSAGVRPRGRGGPGVAADRGSRRTGGRGGPRVAAVPRLQGGCRALTPRLCRANVAIAR
jgi:hypothetical protein